MIARTILGLKKLQEFAANQSFIGVKELSVVLGLGYEAARKSLVSGGLGIPFIRTSNKKNSKILIPILGVEKALGCDPEGAK